MTTHYQKIQALGNKMADNLTTMGISSSFGEGGLTLADKILQIQHFTDGILLCADKAIAQSGDTVKFTVLYLENGESVSGKEVFFDGAYSSGVSRSIPGSVDTPVGKKYAITSLPDVNTYLDKDHSLLIFKNVFPNCMLIANNMQYSGTNFIMDNGVIKYTDSNNVQQTVDVSNYDTSVVYPWESGLVLTDYGVSVTDNYGVATASYDCTGEGAKNITANSGNKYSNTLTIFDAPIYDGDNIPTAIDMSSTTNAVLTDEIVPLKASVTNTNDNPCINIPVVFKQGDTVLGTARTNVLGVATLNHTWEDSDIFDVSASYGNVSDDLTMFVKDKNTNYIAWDIGVISNHNNLWELSSSTSIIRESNGTLFNSIQWGRATLKVNNSIDIPFNTGLVFEFDVIETPSTGFRFNCYEENSHQYILSIGHWKIYFAENKIYFEKNGIVDAYYNFDTSTAYVHFNFNTNLADFTGAKFTNFILYSTD